MTNLSKLLLKKKYYSIFRDFLTYIYRTAEVAMLFVGVLVFNSSYLRAIIPFSIIFIIFNIGLKIPINFIPSPQTILNSFLFSSFTIYVIMNLDTYADYIGLVSVLLMFIGVLKSIVSGEADKIHAKLDGFDTAVHELGHFIANEKYKMFNSVAIELTPNESSLGRLEIEPIYNNVNSNDFISFLMAGFVASNYLLYDHKPHIRQVADIVKLELKPVILDENDKKNIMDIVDSEIRLSAIMEDTTKLIRKNKDLILSLAQEICGKEKVLCKDLTAAIQNNQTKEKEIYL